MNVTLSVWMLGNFLAIRHPKLRKIPVYLGDDAPFPDGANNNSKPWLFGSTACDKTSRVDGIFRLPPSIGTFKHPFQPGDGCRIATTSPTARTSDHSDPREA